MQTAMRTEPLGLDRHCRRYWWLLSDPGFLFVEEPDGQRVGVISTKQQLDEVGALARLGMVRPWRCWGRRLGPPPLRGSLGPSKHCARGRWQPCLPHAAVRQGLLAALLHAALRQGPLAVLLAPCCAAPTRRAVRCAPRCRSCRGSTGAAPASARCTTACARSTGRSARGWRWRCAPPCSAPIQAVQAGERRLAALAAPGPIARAAAALERHSEPCSWGWRPCLLAPRWYHVGAPPAAVPNPNACIPPNPTHPTPEPRPPTSSSRR